MNGDIDGDTKYEKIDLSKNDLTLRSHLPQSEVARHLLWKRLQHFRRNYRLLACILLLPAIFEIIAMGFLQIRPGGDYDNIISLSRTLYNGTQDFLSYENSSQFALRTYNELKSDCGKCEYFNTSRKAYTWLLENYEDYHMKRYGGLSFNDSQNMVWYNNKGYHSMMAWLNDLNSHMLRAEMNDSGYSIRTLNHPLKLGREELSQSSM